MGLPGLLWLCSLPRMTDDEYNEMIDAMNKLGRMNVRILTVVTQVQAHLDVLDGQVRAMQVNRGADPGELKEKLRAEHERVDAIHQLDLKNFLADLGVIQPAADDAWWDRPKG